jgi:predicted kinase
MLVGLPGSGKSTFRSQLESEDTFVVVVSTDDIFEQWAAKNGSTYTDAFNKLPFKAVEQHMLKAMSAAFDDHKNVILDQTNLTTKARARKLGLVPKDYKKTAVVFELEPDELQRRLDKRAADTGKSIPDKVMRSMAQNFQFPTVAEGFDEVIKA